MSEHDKAFNTAAAQYIALKLELIQSEKKLSAASREVDRLRSEMGTAKISLGKHVGQNIHSKCSSSDGRVLTIEYGNNSQHTIKVFDTDGAYIL